MTRMSDEFDHERGERDREPYPLPPGASTPQPPNPMQGAGGDLLPTRAAPTPPFSFAPPSHSSHSNIQPEYPPIPRPERSAASTPARAPRDEFTTVPLHDDSYADQQIGNGSGANAQAAHGRPRSKLGFAPLRHLGGQAESPMPTPGGSQSSFDNASPPNEKRPKMKKRSSSWGNELEWEAYNPATAKDERLRFAEGDAGTTRVSTRLSSANSS